MYCKYCGKQIDDDSRFCNHCGKPLVETTSTPGPIKVDVKADINAKLAPSVDTSWFKKLSNKQKNCLYGYGVWVIIHILLLVSGSGRNGFFPKWSLCIEWDIDMYGLPEFITYVVLIPFVLFLLWKFYISHKSKIKKNIVDNGANLPDNL